MNSNSGLGQEGVERELERVRKILAAGGIAVVHPDTLAAWHLQRTSEHAATIGGVEIRTSEFVPVGVVAAIARISTSPRSTEGDRP